MHVISKTNQETKGKILTTFVWTIPGDTHTTSIPASVGTLLWKMLQNLTC